MTDWQTFSQRAAAVQSDSEKLLADIDQLRKRADPTVPDTMILPELEAALAERKQRLAELQAGDQVTGDAQSRAARRKALRDLLVSLPADIEKTQGLLAAEPPAGEPAPVTQSIRLELRCHLAAVEAQLDSARSELALYDAEDAFQVATLRRDLNREHSRYVAKEIAIFTEEIGRRRRHDAQERVRQAEASLQQAPPHVRPMIEGPVRLDGREYDGSLPIAREVVRIRQENQRFLQRYEAASEELEDVSKWHQQAIDRIEAIGPTSALGLRLRQQRELLPNIESIMRRRTARLKTIEEAQNGFPGLRRTSRPVGRRGESGRRVCRQPHAKSRPGRTQAGRRMDGGTATATRLPVRNC